MNEQHAVLNGRYRLIERIGVGGTAEVWRATDELLNRQVAVKPLHDAADAVLIAPTGSDAERPRARPRRSRPPHRARRPSRAGVRGRRRAPA